MTPNPNSTPAPAPPAPAPATARPAAPEARAEFALGAVRPGTAPPGGATSGGVATGAPVSGAVAACGPAGPTIAIGDPVAVRVALTWRPGGLTVTLLGELDMEVELLARAVLGAALDALAAAEPDVGGSSVRAMVLDVSGLFVDVRGFTVLHQLWRAGLRRGVSVVLAGAPPLLDRMVDILTTPGMPRQPGVADAWEAARAAAAVRVTPVHRKRS